MTDEEQRLRAAVARDPGGPAFLALGEMLFARGEADAAAQVLERGLEEAANGPHVQEARELLALATRNHRGATNLLAGLRASPPVAADGAGQAPSASVLAEARVPDTTPSGLPSGMLLGSVPTPTVVSSAQRPSAPGTRPPPVAPPPPPAATATPAAPRTSRPPPMAPRTTMPPPAPAPRTTVPPPLSPPLPSPPAPDTIPQAMAHPMESSGRPAIKHIPMPTPQDIVGLAARPRVIGGDKPTDAATAALHYSASMGHEHLPALLRAGLLHVPGIPLPPSSLVQRRQQKIQRRWIRRIVALGVLLSIVVGVVLVTQTIDQRKREMAAHEIRKAAETSLVVGSYDALAQAEQKLAALVASDNRVKNALALARVQAAREVLFGVASPPLAASVVGAKEAEAQEARALMALAKSLRQGEGDSAAFDVLATSAQPFSRWMRARYLATRDTAQALSQLQALAKEVPVAAIDHAALLLDAGKLQDGEAQLDALEAAALERAPTQDQALLWAERAILRAERGHEVAAAFDILNVKLDRDLGPRIANMRWYAQSYASLMLDDFSGAETSIAKLVAPFEPRLRARIGLLQILLGDIVSARELFAEIAATDKSVLASELRAAIALTRGRPQEALDAVTGAETIRANILRAQAYIDLRDFTRAKQTLEPLRDKATDSLEVEVYYQMASFLTANATADTAELERVSRRSKSKLGRHALALALVWKGRCDEADRQLHRATEDISPEEPNPALYRSFAAFAEQRLCVGDAAGAKQYADKTLELVDWFEPAQAMAAAAAVTTGGGKKDRERLLAFEDTPEVLCGMCEVVLATQIVPDPKTATPGDLDRASRALSRAATKGAIAAAATTRQALGL